MPKSQERLFQMKNLIEQLLCPGHCHSLISALNRGACSIIVILPLFPWFLVSLGLRCLGSKSHKQFHITQRYLREPLPISMWVSCNTWVFTKSNPLQPFHAFIVVSFIGHTVEKLNHTPQRKLKSSQWGWWVNKVGSLSTQLYYWLVGLLYAAPAHGYPWFS